MKNPQKSMKKLSKSSKWANLHGCCVRAGGQSNETNAKTSPMVTVPGRQNPKPPVPLPLLPLLLPLFFDRSKRLTVSGSERKAAKEEDVDDDGEEEEEVEKVDLNRMVKVMNRREAVNRGQPGEERVTSLEITLSWSDVAVVEGRARS